MPREGSAGSPQSGASVPAQKYAMILATTAGDPSNATALAPVLGDTQTWNGEAPTPSAFVVPNLVGAGDAFGLTVVAPTFTGHTLSIVAAELFVYNGAGTETIGLSAVTPIVLTSDQVYAFGHADWKAPFDHIGADLSEHLGQVASAAGGFYGARASVGFQWT